MARVVFCGAQNTGKTSIAKPVAEATGLKLVTGFARNSPYAGQNLNKKSHSLNQLYLITAIATATSVPNTISDRCPIDSHAYTMWSVNNDQMDDSDWMLEMYQFDWLDQFVEETMKNYDLVVYFPAFDWEIKSDGGVRDLDKRYRLEIDTIMYDMLCEYRPDFKTMPDTSVARRLRYMQEWLRPLGVEFK